MDHLSFKSTFFILSALGMITPLSFFDAIGKLQKTRFNFNEKQKDLGVYQEYIGDEREDSMTQKKIIKVLVK